MSFVCRIAIVNDFDAVLPAAVIDYPENANPEAMHVDIGPCHPSDADPS